VCYSARGVRRNRRAAVVQGWVPRCLPWRLLRRRVRRHCLRLRRPGPPHSLPNRPNHRTFKSISCIVCLRFCVGDRFYLCDNKILCEYDYEERLVFANMAYNPPPLAHLKRQTTHLPPPPTSNAMSGLMNGSSRSGDLNNNMSGSSPAPFAAPPHLKPLGLSASS
ncbi:hypothetical protein HF086_011670, partial [Spodoptera exigua]